MDKRLNALAWQYYGRPFNELCGDRKNVILRLARCYS